jgi:hypothetical protein
MFVERTRYYPIAVYPIAVIPLQFIPVPSPYPIAVLSQFLSRYYPIAVPSHSFPLSHSHSNSIGLVY